MNVCNWKVDTLLVGVYITTTIFKNSLAVCGKVKDMFLLSVYILGKLLYICNRTPVQKS